ncbi:MAG: hypothetical protein ACXWQO_16150 [Bdellovibrionota bacterium]
MLLPLLLSLLPIPAHASSLQLNPTGPYGGIRVRAECKLEDEQRSCAVDTGGPATLTKSSLIKGTYPSLGEVKFGSIGLGGVCQRILLPAMEFAGEIAKREVLSCPEFFEDLSPTIGMDAFEGKAFTFDFPGADLSWQDTWAGLPQPLWRERHWMVIVGKIQGRTVEMGVDTGAPVTLVDKKFVDANPDLFSPSQIPPSEMLIRRGLTAYELKAPIMVGGLLLMAKQIHAGDFSALNVRFPVILGMNHMAIGKWHFDLNRNTWSVLAN